MPRADIRIFVDTKDTADDHPQARQVMQSSKPVGLEFLFNSRPNAEKFRISGEFPVHSMLIMTTQQPSSDICALVPPSEYEVDGATVSIARYGKTRITAPGSVAIATIFAAQQKLADLNTRALWKARLK